jgi:hypothetical protein
LIKSFQSPIYINDYIRRANSYVFFYELVFKYRQWYRNLAPYEIPKIIDIMEPTWHCDYSVLPKGYEDLVVTHCF